jgi:hypothetical protein
MGFAVSLEVETERALEFTIPYSPSEQSRAEDTARRCAHLIVFSLQAAMPEESPDGHGGG